MRAGGGWFLDYTLCWWLVVFAVFSHPPPPEVAWEQGSLSSLSPSNLLIILSVNIPTGPGRSTQLPSIILPYFMFLYFIILKSALVDKLYLVDGGQ